MSEEIKPLSSWDEPSMTPAITDPKMMAATAVEIFDGTSTMVSNEEIKSEESNDSEVSGEAESVEAKTEDSAPEQGSKEAEKVVKSFDELLSEGARIDNNEILFKHKVDGEDVEVSLTDLKTNYAGKVAYDKKFSALDKERKQFVKEKQQIEGYVSEFRQLANSANMVEATKFLGQLTGKAPHAVIDEMISALQPEIERRLGLSQDQLQYENKLAEAQYKAQVLEQKQKMQEQEQASTALETKVSELLSSKNIQAEEWDNAVRELDSRLPANEVITPELVAEYVEFGRASTKTESILGSFADGKFQANDSIKKTLRDIIVENPDFTDEDLNNILSNSLKQQQEKQVTEKLSKKVSATPAKQQQNKVPEFKQITSWDDIL